MLWQPALPIFFFETLHLNYTELSVAITLFKEHRICFGFAGLDSYLGNDQFFSRERNGVLRCNIFPDRNTLCSVELDLVVSCLWPLRAYASGQ